MKTLYTLFLSLILTPSVFGQFGVNMPTNDGVWLVRKATLNPQTQTVQHEHQALCTAADTLIGGTTYQQLMHCANNTYVGGFRENNNTVYFVAKDSLNEHVAYDFNLGLGDSITEVISLNGYAFYENPNPEYNYSTLYVTGVETVNYNGLDRVKMTLTSISSGMETVWIEGIGNTRGFLLDNDGNVGGYGVELICLSETQQTFYPTDQSGACDWHLSLSENEETSISMYPNPTTGSFRIEGDGFSVNANVIVTDCKGHQLIQETLNNGTFETVLARGMYFVTIEENGLRATQKLLVD